MSLSLVRLTMDVYATCCGHALSTDREEIMGLLLGNITVEEDKTVADIWAVSILKRSDRKADRVEISPEQLALASAEAEQWTSKTGKRTRVVGWYHSHPHMTVHPSHVDVRTQGLYQMLDSGFVGLIFSCFNESSHKEGRVQVAAFQSVDVNDGRLAFTPSPEELEGDTPIKEVAQKIQRVQLEEAEAHPSNTNINMELDTVAVADATTGARINDPTEDASQSESSLPLPNVRRFAKPRPRRKMSSFVAAAQPGWGGTEIDTYREKEVPILLVPTPPHGQRVMSKMTDLQRVFFDEEKSLYLKSNTLHGDPPHPLTLIHNSAVYQKALCALLETSCAPLVQAMQDRHAQNKLTLKALVEEEKRLKALLAAKR